MSGRDDKETWLSDWPLAIPHAHASCVSCHWSASLPGFVNHPWRGFTLSTIFRAKGNEAYVVYILSFDSLYDYVEEIENRNKAFTSITRTKAWVRITGTGKNMVDAKKEIDNIIADLPQFKFDFPDMASIRRRLDSDTGRRRREKKTAKETFTRFASLDPKALRAALAEASPEELDHPVLSSTVAELVDAGQYTFQISEDGSIIQIYYSYDASGNHVQAARFAFYKAYPEYPIIDTYYAPGDDDTQIEVKSDNAQDAFDEENLLVSSDGESIDKELFSGPVESDWPVSWLRIEYAPHDAKGVLHYDCHMHLSAFPHSRFVVAGIPNPKQFIELVMALGYLESYRNHRLDAKGQYVDETKIQAVNDVCFPWEESQIFNQIPHFRIPFNTRRRLR